MSLCECGCGNELGNSVSLYFKFDVCQVLWMLSQFRPDPQLWREREREAWIFVSHAPYWDPYALVSNAQDWERLIQARYASAVWDDLHPNGPKRSQDWIPTTEQALPYVAKDWWRAYGPGGMDAHHYGDMVYKPKFLIPATA